MCVHVQMHTSVHVHMCTQMHTHMHARAHTHTCIVQPHSEPASPKGSHACHSQTLLQGRWPSLTGCSSDREGLMERGRPGGDGKLSSRTQGYRHSPPSRPHSLRRGCGKLGPGGRRGVSGVAFCTHEDHTSPGQHCPGAKRPRALETKLQTQRLWSELSRCSPPGSAHSPEPGGLPRATQGETQAQKRCARPSAEGKGVTHCSRPQATSSGPRRCSLT